MRWKDVTSKGISHVVGDSDWQNLRASFVGTWKNHKSENLQKLKSYLGDGKDLMKLRRVQNYVSGSGFRSGKITSPEISSFQNHVKNLVIKAKESKED